MKDKLLLENLLFLYNNLTVLIDLKHNNIEKLFNGNKLITENINYDSFCDIFTEYFEINEYGRAKMNRFISNLVPGVQPFVQPAKFVKIDGEPITLEYKGHKFDENHILLIIEKYKQETPDNLDSLTKVYQKDVMYNKIKEAIENKKQFVLMIIDVDNFKQFNTTFGHMFGDIVLVETAASIKKYLGNRGFMGRVGGDEFLVLAYIENDYDMIHHACTDIRRAIANISNHNIKQAEITATVGCASFPNDANDFDTLMKKAEMALYRGKNVKGRNCFIIYDETKCGKVENYNELDITTMDQSYQIATSANIIAGVFEILNRGGNHSANLEDSLSLIGNYFLLDRVALITQDSNDRVGYKYEWVNPRKPENANLIKIGDKNIPLWRKSYDKTGMLKFVQVESNYHTNPELCELLKSQNTTSILAFEMSYMDKKMGLLRFDMCSTNRFWTQDDISSLLLINKVFTIYLYKEFEDKKHEQELHHDNITGLLNLSKWRNEVFTYLTKSDKYIKYSLLYMHIEGFVGLNDVYGTNYCDKVLKLIADSMVKVYADEAIYCRISGEKFLIFIPHQNKEKIEDKFKTLRDMVEETIQVKGKFKLTAGVYIHNKIDTLSSSIDKANLARKQYKIPENGLVYFVPEFFEEVHKKTELELHMHQALKDGEFLLYLQPKINTITGDVVGAEALTRWNFKHEKLLTPNHFISLFEQNGFITELDFAVFENVCKFLRQCMDEGLVPVKTSVNVSRYQFNFDNYIKTINSIREKYDIDPSLIEIEITEGMYIENIQEISDFINKLHSFGYKISMDDFGSGYSNLSSLATLDFDLIKLDKNFCGNINNKKENIILSFVMNLAKNLKMDVLCEGVETEEFAQYLKDVGCTLVQGFLYERPIPCEQFKEKYLK